MNEELRTIFINLNNATTSEDWDAVFRATTRLGAYVMDPPRRTEAEIWEEKYLDAERSHTRLYDKNTDLETQADALEQQLEAERVRIAELDALLYSASIKARLWCSRATEYGWVEDDES